MDGVLVDSEPIHERALGSVLAVEGFRLPPEEYAALVGTTVESSWTHLFERFPLARSREEYLVAHEAAMLEHLAASPLEPEPGVVALLDLCRAEGYRLALASSSPGIVIRATLGALGLADAFELYVGGDEVARGKPDPEIYLAAAERLGVPPARCLAIEDALHGIESARRAGMAVVAVRTRYTVGHGLVATRVVDSLEGLLEPVTLTKLFPRT